MKEELVEAFGEIFSGGRYSEEAYISCVMMAAGMGNTYSWQLSIFISLVSPYTPNLLINYTSTTTPPPQEVIHI